ncbi:Fructosamine kinase [Actinomadura rubteroloni]|uniref:Fructosamine kinase n=1 Tax=Actinomadura rubteroloni TaxID=1926885 RepID=A0A2P4UNL9_9ACTN|nr:fructosamine kinase family protein [Actinomadura rubteroloni]POM26637.1 Fructosamine kinase [Actinomadura rubteroloni]
MDSLLGTAIERETALGSEHDAWTLHRVLLADGRDVFVKRASRPGLFAAEAAGLRWLAEAGPVAPVAPVLDVTDDLLVLPWLEPVRPDASLAEQFGRELAGTHAAGPGEYGAPWDGLIAGLPLDNTPDAGPWGRWYAERRLAPYLSAPGLDEPTIRLVEQVIEDIDALAGPPEPPSRIHGDLWSENIVWTAERGVLVDPAAHGGHRETDLAMLALFGTPHLARLLAAYDEAAPLAAGWRDRVPLHQLHPLLVHVALYGAFYRESVADAARRALAAR